MKVEWNFQKTALAFAIVLGVKWLFTADYSVAAVALLFGIYGSLEFEESD